MPNKTKAIKSSDDGIANKPLEKFLIFLAVDRALRDKYSGATDDQKAELLAAEPFKMGRDTISALLKTTNAAGAVRARLDYSDQQAATSAEPRRRKAAKKR